MQEIENFEGTTYVPARVDESAVSMPTSRYPRKALKDLVERQGVLWRINPLCGGKDVLLKPVFVTSPMVMG